MANHPNISSWISKLDDVVDVKLLSKLDDFISSSPSSSLRKFDDLLKAPTLKKQLWEDYNRVFEAFVRIENTKVAGISLGHKKFPPPSEGKKSFVLRNAKQYQKEASGDAALSFEKNRVSFDNLDEYGKLIDRKYGHGKSVFKSIDDGIGGEIISIHNDSRAKSILKQAKRQVEATAGTPIKWEVSTKLGAKGIRKLFNESREKLINDIEVIFVPQKQIIP